MMLSTKIAAAVLTLGAAVCSGPAMAYGHWHGRVGVGVYLGVPWGWPGYYYPPAYAYPPAYYYPPVVDYAPVPAYPAPAPAYMPPPAPAAPVATAAWYWCAASKGYYPAVRECPTGWQRVEPQIPPPPPQGSAPPQ